MLLPLISRAFNIKNKPGSHFYVDNVTTTDSGYIDLGFFTHPQEASYKYFMVVNRDGIAWMDTAVITVTLHFSNMQKVTVT
ncbi:hypothetical protein JXM67_09055, partial [candidate division WOR-3 bacterium]|nr:hypothetical protein [candidate division WOR-3 bacterium]